MTKLIEAQWPIHRDVVVNLFRAYADSIDADICFQGFEQELVTLPGKYAEPEGCLLLAFFQEDWVGCVALRSLGEGICEMKRLYVRPTCRGHQIGRLMVEALIVKAKLKGYSAMRLDTLSTMQAALGLYTNLGFKPIAPYYDNPLPGATYLELKLSETAPPSAS